MTPTKPPHRHVVPCPTCRQPARFDADNPFRPFCSERCRSVDLGAWAFEAYRVGSQDGDADPDAPPGPSH